MDKLTELFLQLVKIPSPSGKELDVAKFIKNYFEQLKISANFDGTKEMNDSNSSNLIVKLKEGLPTILFVAHMDTVETGQVRIKPKIENGVITSDGKTILGADDKAALACLMEAIKEISSWEKRPTIIAAFTTKEENGKIGSSLLKFEEKIDYAFNLDGPNNLGDFVNQTLGETSFEIKIIGKAAHAAVEPEKGINAIKAASLLVTKLPIGKDEDGGILNIGTIQGGTANNIVPDEVTLKGQVRSFKQEDLNKKLEEVEEAIKTVCQETGCSYNLTKNEKESIPPAFIDENQKIVKIAKKATSILNLPFSIGKGSYSSDANFLASKYPTITACRGSKLPHSFEENIAEETLFGLKNLIVELVKATRDLE